MKYEYQIKTGEYEFINGEGEGTPEEAVQAFKELKEAFGGGSGLDDKTFNAALDEYLSTNELTNGTELYAQMSKEQQFVFQAVKRSIKRIEAKNK